MFRRRTFERETFGWCRLDARHLDARRFDVRHLKARCLDVRYLDARRLDTRHLLTRILDAIVWTSDVWMSKERCPNIMNHSLEAAVSGTLRLDDAVSTGAVCTQAVYTSDVST